LNLYLSSTAQRLDGAGRQDELDQRVAAGDQIGAIREHNDVVVVVLCNHRWR
jgi:hypothetical protein